MRRTLHRTGGFLNPIFCVKLDSYPNERISPMPDFTHEHTLGREAGKRICGVDEAGRGPLAGPVVAAAVILPFTLPGELAGLINDSKQLSEKKRESLFPLIQSCSIWAVAEASAAEIDEINILQASLLAMRRAAEGLSIPPDHALIDGNKIPKFLPCPATSLVKGDQKSLSVAAASILAKVTRDRIMKGLDQQYPAYGWGQNSGYPTALHLAALATHGATEHHRKSFKPVHESLFAT
jgi:ribonuclease HII